MEVEERLWILGLNRRLQPAPPPAIDAAKKAISKLSVPIGKKDGRFDK